jgi:hypothetical protein
VRGAEINDLSVAQYDADEGFALALKRTELVGRWFLYRDVNRSDDYTRNQGKNQASHLVLAFPQPVSRAPASRRRAQRNEHPLRPQRPLR